MIKHLHEKNTTSNAATKKKPAAETRFQHILKELSADLMQPREQAISALLAKAAEMKLV